MATPVSVGSPQTERAHVRTRSEQERDLQANIQHMIDLQQKISNSSLADDDEHGYADSRESDTLIVDGGGLTLSKRLNTRTHTNLLGLDDDDVEDDRHHAGIKPLHPSSGDIDTDIELSKEHQDVGKGTIVFSANLRGSKYVPGGGSVDGNMGNTQQPRGYLQLESLQNHNQQQDQYRQHMSSHSTTLGSQQQQNLLHSPLPQKVYSGYGSVQEQNHEFHYGNPDFNNIDEQDDYYYNGDRQQQQRGKRSRNIFARLCACVYQPIANILSQENLQRSFCYGGIDGLLTGSGIASAFWGLGLLSVRTPLELRIAVVVFTSAACVADSLCMAMGHVWTTYIVTSNHAWERSYERECLEEDKAESKGRLVDMLLVRGMLKIDAMSLADTLEGYPDLFVSALVGDSLLSSGIQDALLDEPSESEYQQQQQERQPSPVCSERDGHRDLEQSHVKVVYQESQKEGIFMMLGFASFALVPSLLWLVLPLWFDTEFISPSASSSSMSYAGVDDGESVNVPSLIILILSGIVWFLGVWKSRFVDSNWVVFGVETIAVLIVCISSAYGIAALLGYCIGLNDYSDGMSILDKWNLPTNAPTELT